MKRVLKEAYPEAVADTLNDAANAVTKQQIRTVRNKLTTRTKFTTNSMSRKGKALNQARGKSVERMFSRAGTFSPYLWLQEEDNVIEGLNGPKPIATLPARTSKNIQKAIKRKYRLKSTQSLHPGAFGQSGYERLFAGKPKGGNRRYGLYERSANNKKLTMIRNLENESVKIKGIHFHGNAVKKFGTQQYISARFYKNANKRLKKRGVK